MAPCARAASSHVPRAGCDVSEPENLDAVSVGVYKSEALYPAPRAPAVRGNRGQTLRQLWRSPMIGAGDVPPRNEPMDRHLSAVCAVSIAR